MRTILLYLAIIICFCSCYNATSHISIMPNEPAFDSARQVNLAGTGSFDHIEEQASFSISNHIGFEGGLYIGSKGIRIQEGGLNYFFKPFKESNNSISISAGGGYGSYNGEYEIHIDGLVSNKLKIDTKFSNQYLQASYIINRSSTQTEKKIIFSLKADKVTYDYYSLYITRPSWSYYTSYSSDILEKNKTAYIYTPSVMYFQKEKRGVAYCIVQLGIFLKNGFLAHEVKKFSANSIPKQGTTLQPQLPKVFLNIALGIKLDFNN